MQSMRSQIAQLQRGLFAQTLLDRTAPLLDVLRRRIDFESGKANCGCAEYSGREIEMTGHDTGGWSEVIALLRLGKNVRNVVPLVTPGIHVHRSEENAKGRVKDEAETRDVL